MNRNQNFWAKLIVALIAIAILAIAGFLIVRFSLRLLHGANEAANEPLSTEVSADEAFWTPVPVNLDDSAYDNVTAEREYDPDIDNIPEEDGLVYEEGTPESVDYTIEELQNYQGEDLFAEQDAQ